jgi:hypothetical protein
MSKYHNPAKPGELFEDAKAAKAEVKKVELPKVTPKVTPKTKD